MCISPVVKASEGFYCRRCATERLALEAGCHELLITVRDRGVCSPGQHARALNAAGQHRVRLRGARPLASPTARYGRDFLSGRSTVYHRTGEVLGALERVMFGLLTGMLHAFARVAPNGSR